MTMLNELNELQGTSRHFSAFGVHAWHCFAVLLDYDCCLQTP